jgi:hypothetical protein
MIEFMADQETGHATLLSNILGPAVCCHASTTCLGRAVY